MSGATIANAVSGANCLSRQDTQKGNQEILYAQCWEDADILLQALDIQPGDTCLSIASAGDNTLSMLSRGPQKVIAIDQNPAQIACLELRVAAYRHLAYEELLILLGTTPLLDLPANHKDKEAAQRIETSAGERKIRSGEELWQVRRQLYQRCRKELSPFAAEFFDRQPDLIGKGVGSSGKFERYFAIFAKLVLPVVHNKVRIERLLEDKDKLSRRRFLEQEWDIRLFRLLFNIFFGRYVMGWLGRNRSCFKYVEGNVAEKIHERVRYALSELNPADNPYLQWILTASHTTALPHALRKENFELIRTNLDKLEWRCVSLQNFLRQATPSSIDKYNLSDVFEYVCPEEYELILRRAIAAGTSRARLAYWNMLVERKAPEALSASIRPLRNLSCALHKQDKAFFYCDLVIEEIIR